VVRSVETGRGCAFHSVIADHPAIGDAKVGSGWPEHVSELIPFTVVGSWPSRPATRAPILSCGPSGLPQFDERPSTIRRLRDHATVCEPSKSHAVPDRAGSTTGLDGVTTTSVGLGTAALVVVAAIEVVALLERDAVTNDAEADVAGFGAVFAHAVASDDMATANRAIRTDTRNLPG
jgi:hypothetical protein